MCKIKLYILTHYRGIVSRLRIARVEMLTVTNIKLKWLCVDFTLMFCFCMVMSCLIVRSIVSVDITYERGWVLFEYQVCKFMTDLIKIM